MKTFNSSFWLLVCLVFVSACSHKSYYTCEYFPMNEEKDNSSDTSGTVFLFNKKIYTMRIYEVEDTFLGDPRQRYVNHRTVSKFKELQLESTYLQNNNNKLIQTLCLIFLDEKRVLYYTMLQNTPVSRIREIADYPSKICLTDKAFQKDTLLKGKQHYYQGIYRWTSASTIQMEFQKNYAPVRIRKNPKKKVLEEEDKKQRFIRFLCSIDPKGDTLAINTVVYREENMLAENKEVQLSSKKVLGDKFKTVFAARAKDSIINRSDLYDIDYEIIIDQMRKLKFRNFKDDKFTKEREILKSELYEYVDKLENFKRPQIDSVLNGDYDIDTCKIKLPNLKNSNIDSVEVTYIFKNKKHISFFHHLSPFLIKELKGNNKLNAGFSITIHNKQIIGQEAKGIYDMLSARNKEDFDNFIKTISTIDNYRLRVYKYKAWADFIENKLKLMPLNASNTLKKPTPLVITYKLVTNKNTIPQIKKCEGSAIVYSVKVENEFRIDSIKQAFNADSSTFVNRYYLKDKAVDDKNLVFYKTNQTNQTNGKDSVYYMPKWRKRFSPERLKSLNDLLNKVYALEDFEENGLIKDENGKYYIKEEIIKDKPIATW